MIKVLNLYAGIGGNRKFWKNVNVTAVEINPEIARAYKDNFPDDDVVIGNAHEFLLYNFKDYDFIWSSPPCQTHSRMRHNLGVKGKGFAPVYPDLTLYEEIIFLQHNAKCKWVVENVKPYYHPLINPSFELQRHYFWSNFYVKEVEFDGSKLRSEQIPDLQKKYGFDLCGYKLPNKRQVLRNCVLPQVGEYIISHV